LGKKETQHSTIRAEQTLQTSHRMSIDEALVRSTQKTRGTKLFAARTINAWRQATS